ncbi:hypothetical protein AAur_0429 [Paenarthrobacter aurescens TC1]|uniref:Resolvase/invertase-type recombinase catalytic domain-containing protein n=2 Tax=Paenarthrobacter aurescens TaxID=43663 RepID=A1R1X4_PAEAT|nr:hypothetical protein AAur_0429 [Paenarthrobacter aurescens TC1]
MLDRLGPGDETVVWKLDRLGHNTGHLLEFLDHTSPWVRQGLNRSPRLITPCGNPQHWVAVSSDFSL